MFEHAHITVPCPACDYPNDVEFREVQYKLRIPCRGCLRDIQFVREDGGIERAERSLKSALQELNLKLQIKL